MTSPPASTWLATSLILRWPHNGSADHCVANSVVDTLTKAGHEVFRLRDHLPTDSPDSVVIKTAQSLNAVLISLNGDFADIAVYPPALYQGIVALRAKNHPESMPLITATLVHYLTKHPDAAHYFGKLLIVEPTQIRTRSH